MRLFKVIIVCIFTFAGFLAKGQSQLTLIKENLPFARSLELKVKPNTLYTNLIPNFTYSSLSIAFENKEIDNAYIFLGSTQKERIIFDEHNVDFHSGLLIADKTQEVFSFFSGNFEGKVIFKLLFAPPATKASKKKDQENAFSEGNKPETIDQSIWREGLPDPKPNPDTHQVYHTIIHHSAGSNSDKDYTKVVRNIYLFHTQNNGWDDIGYNFVIAQNGQIFDGRDNQGVADEDNIKGAHFCGKNNNTMGVCLLGNYETTQPTDATLSSLANLLAWKFPKEKISPFDYFQHPRNTQNALYLPALGGHRDGCSTLCPGENIFSIIPEIKEKVCLKMDSCQVPIASIKNEDGPKINVFPNPTRGKIQIMSENQINSISIYSFDGRLIQIKSGSSEIDLTPLNDGMYLLNIHLENSLETFQKVLKQD